MHYHYLNIIFEYNLHFCMNKYSPIQILIANPKYHAEIDLLTY